MVFIGEGNKISRPYFVEEWRALITNYGLWIGRNFLRNFATLRKKKTQNLAFSNHCRVIN